MKQRITGDARFLTALLEVGHHGRPGQHPRSSRVRPPRWKGLFRTVAPSLAQLHRLTHFLTRVSKGVLLVRAAGIRGCSLGWHSQHRGGISSESSTPSCLQGPLVCLPTRHCRGDSAAERSACGPARRVRAPTAPALPRPLSWLCMWPGPGTVLLLMHVCVYSAANANTNNR